MSKMASSSNCIKSEHEEDSAMDPAQEILPGFQTMDQFSEAALKKVITATKMCNGLPSVGDEWEYYTSFSGFQAVMNAQGAKILNMMQTLLKHQGISGNLTNKDLEEKFDSIGDANDALLERVASALDEADGKKKEPETVIIQCVKQTGVVSGSWNRSAASVGKEQKYSLLAGRNIERPQLKFKHKVDNRNTPFVPKLTDKANSLKPLAILPEYAEDGTEYYGHPYQYELDMYEPSPDLLKRTKPCKPQPLDSTPLEFISSPSQLEKLMSDLQMQKAIAVDVEHHSYRTFQGFTCLLQISTQDKDYIVDTLELRDDLEVLNQVFTKKSILKVFHGANRDMDWLQRDLGVYVVGMFDTYQAAKALGMPHLSLSYLMKHFCDVDADKQFQMADWRMRPLPKAMIKYAREDTHYLLYISDMLRNQLLDNANGDTNVLKSVFDASTNVCKTRYEKPVLHEMSHLMIYRKNKKSFNNQQMAVLRDIYRWRDKMARSLDESTGYILPNHMLLQIAQVLPREMQGILACCNPIPPLINQHLNELHAIVYRARQLPLQKFGEEDLAPPVQSDLRGRENMNSLLHCPHDLSRHDPTAHDLPTLLDKNYKAQPVPGVKSDGVRAKVAKTSAVFSFDSDAVNKTHGCVPVTFLSPYRRFQTMKSVDKLANDPNTPLPDAIVKIPQIRKLIEHYKKLNEAQAAAAEQQPPTDELMSTKPQKRKEREEETEETSPTPLKHELPKKKRKKKKSEAESPVPELADQTAEETAEPEPEESVEAKEADAVEPATETNSRGPKKKRQKKEKKKSIKPIALAEEETNQPEPEPEPEFKPYDYSTVDYRRFQGSSAPNKYMPKKQRRGGGSSGNERPRLPPKRSGRSLTYSNKT